MAHPEHSSADLQWELVLGLRQAWTRRHGGAHRAQEDCVTYTHTVTETLYWGKCMDRSVLLTYLLSFLAKDKREFLPTTRALTFLLSEPRSNARGVEVMPTRQHNRLIPHLKLFTANNTLTLRFNLFLTHRMNWQCINDDRARRSSLGMWRHIFERNSCFEVSLWSGDLSVNHVCIEEDREDDHTSDDNDGAVRMEPCFALTFWLEVVSVAVAVVADLGYVAGSAETSEEVGINGMSVEGRHGVRSAGMISYDRASDWLLELKV